MDAKKLGILILILAFSGLVFAEGHLDETFGTGGKVITDFNQRIDAASIALQSDGKMVVAGNNASGIPILIRYNTDGSVDTTFGTNGIVTAIASIGAYLVRDTLAIQQDGKIVLSGQLNSPETDTRVIVLCRFNQDGTVDGNFGNNGAVITTIHGDDRPLDLALQQNGRIVVTGITTNDVFVVRYLSDGSLDSSFDLDGILEIIFSGASSTGRGLAIDPNGNIIVVGAHLSAGLRNFLAIRLKSTGQLDPTFGGGDGYVITNVLDDERAQSVALQADGKIVVAGEGDHGPGTDTDFVVVRYDAAGNLDPTFDGNGKKAEVEPGDQVLSTLAIRPDGRIAYTGTTTDSNGTRTLRTYCYNSDASIFYNFSLNGGAGTPDTGESLIVQSDNKVVIAATDDHDVLMHDLGAVRLTSTGTLDSSFGGSGMVATLIPGSIDGMFDTALQPDGKIVTLGSTFVDSQIVRYNSDGTIDTTFGAGGRVIVDFSGGKDLPAGLAILNDGKIIVAGSVYYSGPLSNCEAYATLAKFNSDGSPDTTFGSNGTVKTDATFGLEQITSIAIDSNGRIIVSGTTQAISERNFLTMRYNSNGSLDSTFGFGGMVFQNLQPGSDELVNTLTIQPDDTILVAGCICDVDCDLIVTKYLTNGIGDNTFGSFGTVITSILDYDCAQSVLLQPGGKIILGGGGWDNGSTISSVLLARYNSDGTLDSSFGNGGRVNTPIGQNATIGKSLLYPNGQLFVTGGVSQDLFLAEYNDDGSLHTEFGNNGILISDFGNRETGQVIQNQSDGKIIVGGTSSDALPYNWDIVLARYNLSLFSDDFEDGVADWQFLKPSWTEIGGNLVGTPSRKAIAIAPSTFTGCAENCMVEATVQSAGGSGSKISMLTWYQDKTNYVEVLIQEQKVILKQRVNKKVVAKAKGLTQILPNQSYRVNIQFDGNAFQVFVDGNLLITMNKAAGTSPSGTVGFQVKGTVGTFGEIFVDQL
jgi:uncharacterized delta-60 repeat protein